MHWRVLQYASFCTRTVFHICVFLVFMFAVILARIPVRQFDGFGVVAGAAVRRALSNSHTETFVSLAPSRKRPRKWTRFNDDMSSRVPFSSATTRLFRHFLLDHVFFGFLFFSRSACHKTTQPQPEWTERWRSSLLELRVGLHGVGSRCHWHTQDVCVFLSSFLCCHLRLKTRGRRLANRRIGRNAGRAGLEDLCSIQDSMKLLNDDAGSGTGPLQDDFIHGSDVAEQ